jgi:hypothetical protein
VAVILRGLAAGRLRSGHATCAAARSRDAEAARRALLAGPARDAGLADLLGEIAPLHPRDPTFPGQVFLGLAADALAWAGASRDSLLPLEGTREQFLPGFSRRGRDRRKLQYAVLAAAAMHGGAESDLLDEVAWWQATISGSTRSWPERSAGPVAGAGEVRQDSIACLHSTCGHITDRHHAARDRSRSPPNPRATARHHQFLTGRVGRGPGHVEHRDRHGPRVCGRSAA